MRIISKFKDYYDYATAFGIDPKLVYVRTTNSHTISSSSTNRISQLGALIAKQRRRVFSDRFKCFYVGFCGNVYSGLSYYTDSTGSVVHSSHVNCTHQRHFIWNVSTIDLVILSHKMFSHRLYNIETVEQALKTTQFHTPISMIDEFQQEGIVCLVVDDDQIVINPRLLDYNFQHVIDPMSAFQEISMFISGPLSTSNNMIELSDRDRISKHGFDKQSFRHRRIIK